jgi:alpha-glucuronidase
MGGGRGRRGGGGRGEGGGAGEGEGRGENRNSRGRGYCMSYHSSQCLRIYMHLPTVNETLLLKKPTLLHIYSILARPVLWYVTFFLKGQFV